MSRILVIEDEELLREEVLEWLMLEGHDPIGASNGLEGLEIARKQVPDLIVSDITMPHLDGFAMLMELRSNPSTAHIPFIFMTARAAHEDVRKGMTLGADDYITKPFTHTELLNAIASRLKRKESQLENHQQEVQQWQAAFEEARTQRLLKARVVGMFSHDFRNPLASILSSVGLLQNYDDRLSPERKRTHLSKIEGSVKRLMQMLDDMLVVAQMDGGYLELTPKLIDVTQFVREIVDEFADIYVDSHTVRFESDVVGEFAVDPKLLRQVVSNLTSNALKYSPTESSVKVTLRNIEDEIIFEVRDEGIGIPQADLLNLFQPFQRASNVGDLQGTGLGLVIVKQAVDLHGGSISVESEINRGTLFSVRIPKILAIPEAGY